MATTTGKDSAASAKPARAGGSSLSGKDVAATIAVKDLGKAREFYERTLGLQLVDTEGDEAVVYRTGTSMLLVYVSQFAGTNQATCATWFVGEDLEAIIEDLRARNVKFEHYDMPDTTRKGDVHIAGGTRVAWFKDPDGNIISLVNSEGSR